MFLKLGSTYYANLTVTDSNGNMIDNDTPTMTVYDLKKNLYHNGLTWTSSLTELVMTGVGAGVYQSQFICDVTGSFRVTMTSRNYEITKVESIEVYDTDVAEYQWQTGVPYTINYESLSADIPVCSISRDSDGKYLSADEWVNECTEHSMTLVNDSYKFSFTPPTDDNYGITVKCGDSQFYYILKSMSVAENIAPVLVTNQTLKALDGTQSDVVDHKGVPLSEVSVTAFDISTKKVVGKAVTNLRGEWSMLLKPGTWQFLFEKQGHISVGFERTVQ